MKLRHRLTAWIPHRWQRARTERELDEELRAHLAIEVDDLIDAGLSPIEADARARRQFGVRVEAVKDEVREARGWGAGDRLRQDLRAAWRQVRRAPAFTMIAVGSLALGIGANTAVYTLTDAVFFRTLPLPDPDRLVQIQRSGTRQRSSSANGALFNALRTRDDLFAGVAMLNTDAYKVRDADGGSTTGVWGQAVTGGYHDLLGVRALIGRTLTPADDASPQPAAVVVLGYRYWQRHFQADPNVLGRLLLINGQPHAIVGVTPPEFFGVETGMTIDITVPLERPATDDRETWRGTPIVARLADGVSAERASAAIDAIFQPFMDSTSMPPDTRAAGWQHLDAVAIPNGLGPLRRELRMPLLIVGGSVLLVLLLACANLAGLLMARGVARQREMAIRAALGAGRWRVARMLLMESLLIAALGTAAGLLLAWTATTLLLAALPADGVAPITLDLRPGLRVLAFAVALLFGTTLLVGLAPTLQLTRRRHQPALTDRSRGTTSMRQGPARAMVVIQVALALLLVISAALFARSLRNLRQVDAGFARPGVVLFALDLEGSGYDYPRLLRLNGDLLARLRQLPGVERASAATITPLSGADEIRAISVPGVSLPALATPTIPAPSTPAASSTRSTRSRPSTTSTTTSTATATATATATEQTTPTSAHLNHVSDDFFDVFGIPLLHGRAFDARDLQAGAPDVAVVSARFARLSFGDTNPLGRTIVLRVDRPRAFTIVGVARDVRQDDLRIAPEPLIYMPLSKRASAPRLLRFALRSATPAATLGELPRVVHDVDPALLVSSLRTMDGEVDARLMRERLLATLGGFFGLVALLLAAIGVYGLLAYAVSRRTSEIGLRLALGATRARVVWLVCRECLLLAGAGLAIGLMAAAWMARTVGHLLDGMLFGLTTTDGVAAGGGVVLLVGAALLAGALPAWRAARVDPLTALRHE